MSKIAEAEERLAAETARAPKEGAPATATKEEVPDPEEPEGRPKYLRELSFCKVAITVEGLPVEGVDQIVVSDPGYKHSVMLDGLFNDSEEIKAKALVAITKALHHFEMPSVRESEVLAVEEGDQLPDPRELLRDHINSWERWRREKLMAEKQALVDARKGKADTLVLPDIPDQPYTALQHLYEECMPSRTLMLIVEGINWAINPSPKEGPGN